MNNYNLNNNRPPANMMNGRAMPGINNSSSVDDFGSNLNHQRMQKKQRPPMNNMMMGNGPPMNNNMMGNGPPMNNNMMGNGPPMNNNIMGNVPPMSNNMMGNGPPMNNNMMGNGPPMNNNMMGNGPPMNNNMMGNGPPTNNNMMGNGPPTNNNMMGNGPPTNNNMMGNGPPMNNNMMGNGPPMNHSNGAGRHNQQQLARNGPPPAQQHQKRNMAPMGGTQQMQQSPMRNMNGPPPQMRNMNGQQQRNVTPMGAPPPHQMRNGGPSPQQQQYNHQQRNLTPGTNSQQQKSPMRNMGAPINGQSPQQMRNISPMREASPVSVGGNPNDSMNNNMNPYMQNNGNPMSQSNSNNNPYGAANTSLTSSNNPYGSSGSVNNTFDKDINNNFLLDEPQSNSHKHSRFSNVEVPDNNSYQDINVIKPQRVDNGNIAANNRVSESIQLPKRKEVLRPLDHDEFNRRRTAAETNESPKVQLLWIRAVIESTQDPALISTIDIDGNYLPQPLTNSKDIRKNRDVFLHKGLKKLKKLVSRDYPDANYYLGTLYTNGKILEKNYDKAFDYYMKAANGGNGEGMYRAAICYEMGIGTEKDEQLAFELYSKASLLQIVPAMFKLGMIYLKGSLDQMKSAPNAIEWLEKAASFADEQNPHALFELGKLYEGFYPVQAQNQADNDLSEEDSNFLKELKIIIPTIDERTALSLYIKAAKLNYSPAQSKLGWCYEYGKLGCNVDSKRSIGWYCKAAEQGYALAEMGLCGWYLTGAKGLLESNDHEAYVWATKAAEKGLSKAEYALGHFKETGLGTDKNLEEAREWYAKAANQGHPKAIQKLNMLFG